MEIEVTSVRWVNEEAREAYEKWQTLIERELDDARLRACSPTAIEASKNPAEAERIYRLTRDRVQPMIDEAGKLYAAYTMPAYMIRTPRHP